MCKLLPEVFMKALSFSVCLALALQVLAVPQAICADISSQVTISALGEARKARVEFGFESDSSASVYFDRETKDYETVFTSDADSTKPVDVKSLEMKHDSLYVWARITLYKPVDGDVFISIAMDVDGNPKTGMPKANDRSYNQGGEDFFARYSREYGADKFVLDRWVGPDTVETGGLGFGTVKGDTISFAIPRRAIGEPSGLDFKLVARTFQDTNPDLSPDHLKYTMVGAKASIEAKTEKAKGKTFAYFDFPAQVSVGIHRVHVGLSGKFACVANYVEAEQKVTPPWQLLARNPPVLFKRMCIKNIFLMQDQERVHFRIDFWDGLSGMGNYDKKILVLADTDPKTGGFSNERFCKGNEDYIFEVATESGRLVSNVWNYKEGIGGFRNSPLTDLVCNAESGTVQFSVGLKRIGTPKNISFRVACGGWKAPEGDWDIAGPVSSSLVQSDVPVFTTIFEDNEDPSFPVDMKTIECANNPSKGNVLFKIGFYKDPTASGNDVQVSIFINSDQDASTGMFPENGSPGGEDFIINVYMKGGNIICRLLSAQNGPISEVAELEGTVFVDGKLLVPVPLEMIGNPKSLSFYVVCMSSVNPMAQDKSPFDLAFTITGEMVEKTCPTTVKVSVKPGDSAATVMWSEPSAQANGFLVYRIEGNSAPKLLTPIPLPANTRQFEDTGLTNGMSYSYYVRVTCPDGSLGPSSTLATTVPRKQEQPYPKIEIAPTSINLGSMQNTKGAYATFKVKNSGPGDFSCEIKPEPDYLLALPDKLVLQQGKSADIKIEVTRNLAIGQHFGRIMVKSAIGTLYVEISLNVPEIGPQFKFVSNLIAEPMPFAIKLSWLPPTYRSEELKGYRIERTEYYRGKLLPEKKIFESPSGKNEFLDSDLDPQSVYNYKVVPVWPSGDGIPRIAESSPSAPQVVIMMKVGIKTAVVNDSTVELDAPPYITKGKTMVPFRFIGENLFAKVDYDDYTKTVTFKRGRTTVRIKIGESKAEVNGTLMTMDPPATIKDGRTFIPVRFVSDALGAKTLWEASARQVVITYP